MGVAEGPHNEEGMVLSFVIITFLSTRAFCGILLPAMLTVTLSNALERVLMAGEVSMAASQYAVRRCVNHRITKELTHAVDSFLFLAHPFVFQVRLSHDHGQKKMEDAPFSTARGALKDL